MLPVGRVLDTSITALFHKTKNNYFVELRTTPSNASIDGRKHSCTSHIKTTVFWKSFFRSRCVSDCSGYLYKKNTSWWVFQCTKDTKSGYIDSLAWVMRSFLLVFIPISIFLLLLLLLMIMLFLTFVRLERVGIKKVMLLRWIRSVLIRWCICYDAFS